MRKYRHPKLEEFEKLSRDVVSYGEDFLEAVDSQLQLFPPTLNVYPFDDGIEVRYSFSNTSFDYIEVHFYTNGHFLLFHSYEDVEADQEYQEMFQSCDVDEIADKFQEIISKINIYS